MPLLASYEGSTKSSSFRGLTPGCRGVQLGKQQHGSLENFTSSVPGRRNGVPLATLGRYDDGKAQSSTRVH